MLLTQKPQKDQSMVKTVKKPQADRLLKQMNHLDRKRQEHIRQLIMLDPLIRIY